MSDRLLHTKVSKRKPLTHFPKKEDGHDGDMQIVSIAGKGTYLCIKDKSEWKISEKFNPRNKFDTHIFDEITTRKIKSRGGLVATFKSTTESIGALVGKTFTSESNVTQPIIEIGDGINTGVISSHESTSLFLKSGGSSTSSILLQSTGKITSTMNGVSSFDVVWNDNSSGVGELNIVNRNVSSAANASVNLKVKGASNADYNDPYVRYFYVDDVGASSRQWSHGIDGSDSSKFKLNYTTGETTLTPSNGTTRLEVASTGDLTLSGNSIILGIDLDGSDKTITFGHGTLKTIMGIDDSANAFVINTDDAFDATLANNSFSIDASHNVIVAGTLTSSAGVCGGPKVTNHVTNDAADIMVVSDFGANAALKIDADQPDTPGAEDSKGLWIDYVRAVATSGTAAHNDIGIDLDVTSRSLGTSSVKGMDIDVVGHTDGTHTAIGIDISCTGADTNTHLQLSHDATNYCTMATLADGATTLATVDSDGAVAHLTLDADGDIILDSATGYTNFYIDGDTNDYAHIRVGLNGTTTLATIDASHALAHLTLDPDGDLLLQPATHTYSALPIGFTQDEPTFDATDTIITFSTKGNKAKLTLTDNCTDIHFKFPAVSGNFICVLLQDGTGGRTISNWKTQDSAGNAGAGNSGLVLWAGGTAPSNTETADKADIVSFYWDADNEIAYGTYTYKF